MNNKSLDEKLDKSIDTFINEINIRFPEDRHDNLTTEDIRDFSKQIAYLLDDFRKNIIDYLK